MQLTQTNERTVNVVVDSSSPFQTQLCIVHNDNDISAPIDPKCNGWQKVHLYGKLLHSSTWKRFLNICERSACFHWEFSLWCRQCCNQDRNFRDGDLAKPSRPRLHQKSPDWDSWLEIWDRDSRLQNLCNLPKFFKYTVITSKLNFFLISGIFPTCFGCYLAANITNKKSLNYWNCPLPVLCSIQSLVTETWNLLDQWFLTFFSSKPPLTNCLLFHAPLT